MGKGVLGNDPFKRGAADRSADAPAADAKALEPQKPALPDPREGETKQRVKGRKIGAPFLNAPDKEPQKTRIEKKQKPAPPLKPPSAQLKRSAKSDAAKTEGATSAARTSDATSAPADSQRGESAREDSARSDVITKNATDAATRSGQPQAGGTPRIGHEDDVTVPSANRFRTPSITVTPPLREPPKEHVAAPTAVEIEDTAPTTKRLSDSESDAFDLKTGERRPIREALRTMTEAETSAPPRLPESTSTREQVFDARRTDQPSTLQKVAVDALGKAVIAAAGLVKAVRAGIGAAGAVNLDAYGKDESLGQSLSPVTDFLYDQYWRVQVSGAERLPAGPCILVANHSGALPYDGPVLHEALKRERPDLPSSRWLIEDQIFYAPVIGTLLNRLGAVRANPENAIRLLEENRPLIVFPEGIHGLQKPYAERYQLKRFGRGGFVKIALQTGTPIFPVAIVGAEETSPLLARIPTSLFGMPYLPLSPLGPLPLPAKWHIRIGAPITVDDLKSAGDEESIRVQRGTELTREAIQGMLETILRDRPNAFR